MILNLYRTTVELGSYLDNLSYPRARIFTYLFASTFAGILFSNSSRASELPILTLTAILFGFTINAIILLGNSSDQYLSGDQKHSDQLESYYKKSLYISIHTLGVGIITIVSAGIFQLFPNFDVILLESPILGYDYSIELISIFVYSLVTYYLIVFSIVIASTAELVKIRV